MGSLAPEALEGLEVTLPAGSGPASPSARRFDPPLVKLRGVVARDLALAELCARIDGHLAGTGASARSALRHGGIHLAGRPIDPDASPGRVCAGTRLVVYAFVREPESVGLGEDAIVASGAGWLAVDKPAWLPTQRTRASGRAHLEAAVRALTGSDAWLAVHRLDRTTSGVVLFAEGPRHASRLQRAFQAGTVAKRYAAIVSPAPPDEDFTVSGWIGRVPHPRRFAFGMLAGPGDPARRARQSTSHFRVRARSGPRAWVDARPVTGRTHQLRVHLAHAGAPIAGDDLYGRPWTPGRPERALLHSASLLLAVPGEPRIEAEAEVPADLRRGFAGDPLAPAPAPAVSAG